MLLKQISDKGATIAWSPLRHLPFSFVAGTKEGAGGGFSDYGGELTIHQFDPSTPTTECRTVASLKTQARFSSVAWGAMSSKPALRHGLVAGGMADGAVMLWDAAAVSAGGLDAIATISRHQSAVRALQFNPNAAAEHLLAAASIDGEISIINLDVPASPVLASPLAGGQRLDSEVTSLAWNTSVQHILATATVSGVIVVWDLKENKPWCHLRDPHRSSISDIAWNPEDGLYLATACDDDSRPVVRVWDLRSSTTTPLCEFSGGHAKGVLSVDWCPWDSNLLVSCGKDARTLVWDIQQGRPVAEIPSSSPLAPSALTSVVPPSGIHQHHHDGSAAMSVFGGPAGGVSSDAASAIFGSGGASGSNTLGGLGAGANRRYLTRWSKRAPGLIASCSLDRCVSVHSVVAMGQAVAAPPSTGGSADATLRRAPRWLRRPVGASFSFGGKLVSFMAPLSVSKAELRSGSIPYTKRIQLSSLTTDHDFVSRALELEGALAGVETGAVDPRAFCDTKASEASSRAASSAAATWTFMRLLVEPDARQRVLSYVGYDSVPIAAELTAYSLTGSSQPAASSCGAEAVSASSMEAIGGDASPHHPGVSAAWVGSGNFHVPESHSCGSAADLFGSTISAPETVSVVAQSGADSVFGSVPSQRKQDNDIDGSASNDAHVSAPKLAGSDSTGTPLNCAVHDDASLFERRRLPSATDDGVLKRALLIGDFQSAVAVCLTQERYADALLLASCGSAEVWAAAKDQYFRRRAAPLTPILSAVTRGDFGALVESTPLSAWRDVLGLLCTYAKPDEFSSLCESLGDRLCSADESDAACTVYMAALSTSKAVSIWARCVQLAQGEKRGELLELVEKSCMLRYIVYSTTGVAPSTGAQPETAGLVRFCSALANEGFLPTAAFFAARIVDIIGAEGATLRHRLSRAFSRSDLAYPAAQALSASPAPFVVSNIDVCPARQAPAMHAPSQFSSQYAHASGAQSPPNHDSVTYADSRAVYHPHEHVRHPQQTPAVSAVALPGSTSFRAQQVPTAQGSGGVAMPHYVGSAHASTPSIQMPAAPKPFQATQFQAVHPPVSHSSPSFVSAPPPPAPSHHFAPQQQQQQVVTAVPPALPPAPRPVPPEMQAALQSLASTVAALGALQLTAMEQRQLQEATAALSTIQSKIQDGRMAGDAAAKLSSLAAQCAAYDFVGAQKTQTELASVDWAQTKDWLRGIRGMVSLALIKSGGR